MSYIKMNKNDQTGVKVLNNNGSKIMSKTLNPKTFDNNESKIMNRSNYVKTLNDNRKI